MLRTFANYRGTRFSLAKTVGYSCVYVGVGILFTALSFLSGVSYLLALPEMLVAALAAFWSYNYTDKRVSFWRADDGSLFFKGGIAIYLIYLAGIIARFCIDVVYIGPSMFGYSGVVLSGTALYASMAVDILVSIGVGLLIGRSIRVERRFRKIESGEEQIASSPLLDYTKSKTQYHSDRNWQALLWSSFSNFLGSSLVPSHIFLLARTLETDYCQVSNSVTSVQSL